MADVTTYNEYSDVSGWRYASHRVGHTHLYVEHDPRRDRYELRVGHVDSALHPGPHATLIFPSGRDPSRAFLATDHNGVRDRLRPAPSPDLRIMIERHAENPDSVTWAALLDKLADEYPETHDAISAHTAARYAT